MVVIHDHNDLLRKLKEQVRVLKARELKTREKLKLALSKMETLGEKYKIKLERKVRVVQGKLPALNVNSLIQLALRLERQMLTEIEVKSHALAKVVEDLERKYKTNLTPSESKKTKSKVKPRKPKA